MAEKSTSSTAVCQCDHRTSFVILTSRVAITNSSSTASNDTGFLTENDIVALDLITRIGVGVSAPLLLIIVLATVYFRQQRKMLSRVILAHICFNMAVSQLIFIAGINYTENAGACSAIALFLHFFLLVRGLYILSTSPLPKYSLFHPIQSLAE